MKIEYPERYSETFSRYDVPEGRMKDRMRLDDRIDYYTEKLYLNKRELANTKGFFARLKLKQQIREAEDILNHLKEVANHWWPTVYRFLPKN